MWESAWAISEQSQASPLPIAKDDKIVGLIPLEDFLPFLVSFTVMFDAECLMLESLVPAPFAHLKL